MTQTNVGITTCSVIRGTGPRLGGFELEYVNEL